MERAWIIVSILCLIGAGIFLLLQNFDAALVTAALGAVAWFLNYRVKLRGTITEPTEIIETEDNDFEDQDED